MAPNTETEQIVNEVLEAYIPLPGAAVQVDRPWSLEEMAVLNVSSGPVCSLEERRRAEAETKAQAILGPGAVAWYGPIDILYRTRWHYVAGGLKQIYKGTTWRDALKAAEKAVR